MKFRQALKGLIIFGKTLVLLLIYFSHKYAL